MQTDFPTVEIFFVFAFTFCRMKVYKTQEDFARQVLLLEEVEFVGEEASSSWQEIDTRVLLDLVARAIPKLVPKIMLQPQEVKARTIEAFALSA